MSEFWKIAYSTEITSQMTICYDRTDCDYSNVYEHNASYAEFRKEMSFNFDGYDC